MHVNSVWSWNKKKPVLIQVNLFTFIYPNNLTYTGYNTTDTSLFMVFVIIFYGDTLHHYIAFRQTTIISMHYTHLKLKEFFISINKTMNSNNSTMYWLIPFHMHIWVQNLWIYFKRFRLGSVRKKQGLKL